MFATHSSPHIHLVFGVAICASWLALSKGKMNSYVCDKRWSYNVGKAPTQVSTYPPTETVKQGRHKKYLNKTIITKTGLEKN